ncbi:MAG: aminotransferase class V-fold PLP-dependent enzyme, partial [Flavobacteriaceae bacterium]|nr:aminotransferase class V-fold PLP-dependent enzyme [Flavobacteriaceae bacterium]
KISFKMSKLINSDNDEVLVGESTSVNLYKILYSLLNSCQFKKNLVTDCLNFPSDIYIIEGLKEYTEKKEITVINYGNNLSCNINILKKSIKENPGIYCLSLVTYKSSFLYPIKELNEFAEKNKSIIVWDCSHAIGVIDIDVKASKTKAAIGCTYKFLNGGPGSPSFLYVSNNLLSHMQNPVKGWFGHLKPFDFENKYEPAKNINKFKAGTPAVLSLVPVNNGLDLVLEAGIKNIRNKSIELGEYLIKIINIELNKFDVKITSPIESKSRGSHITIQHKEAWKICKLLVKGDKNRKKIIPDFRPENNIRLGYSPLYVSFIDLYETVITIKEILENKEYLKIDDSKSEVT